MPNLSPAQLQTLKTHLAANTATVLINGVATAINAVPQGGQNAQTVADWYNLTASPAYLVWNPATPLKSIRAAVDLSKYTPTDNPPASTNNVQGTNDALLYQNRALVCQLKQANAIFLITGEGAIDCSPLQLRQSFNDCMTLIPSGASGATQNAGWGTSAAPGAVRLAMQRAATNAEKLFAVASTAAPNAGNVGADPRGGATNPDTLVVVGSISDADVRSCWGI
jgi:hypothetical protein